MLAVAALIVTACSPPEKTPRPKNPKIEIEQGMRYFVGGPFLVEDAYGRSRVKNYEGEVLTPPSRGVVIGLKEAGDGSFESKTWVMGRLAALSRGVFDKDGLQRSTYKELYTGGKVSRRHWTSYDDVAGEMTTKSEVLDTDSGAIIQTKTIKVPYKRAKRVADDDSDSFFDSDDEGEEEEPDEEQ